LPILNDAGKKIFNGRQHDKGPCDVNIIHYSPTEDVEGNRTLVVPSRAAVDGGEHADSVGVSDSIPTTLKKNGLFTFHPRLIAVYYCAGNYYSIGPDEAPHYSFPSIPPIQTWTTTD